MSQLSQSGATPPREGSSAFPKASSGVRFSVQAILASQAKNLEFLAEVARIRRDGVARALQLQQGMIQNALDESEAMKGLTAAQRDTLRKVLATRLTALRNFADITGASNQAFLDAAQRRMANWSDQISRSLLGMGGASSDPPA
jgi:hypothetical protein